MKKTVFIYLLFFVIGLISVFGYHFLTSNPTKSIPEIINTVTKPTFSIDESPSESVRGNIKSLTHDVFWESRIATDESKLNFNVILQQGETIRTGDTGKIEIEFLNEANIAVTSRTQIDFVQTLPVSFVINIASGSATFKKLSGSPVSIRAFHLLVRQNSGELRIEIDNDKGLINLNVLKGSITVAYNDRNLDSHVADFFEGQVSSFNDATRKFE